MISLCDLVSFPAKLVDFAGVAWLSFVVGLLVGFFLNICSSKVRHFVAKRVPWIGSYAWLEYMKSANAVVVSDIDSCNRYLEAYFSKDGSGEIWLFRSDLRAFWNCTAFDNLYAKIVDKRHVICSVRILVSAADLENVTADHWRQIHNHISKLDRPEIIKYRFIDEAWIAEKEAFLRYASDEAFIFYVRGTKLIGSEAMCVHRRFDKSPLTTGNLRVTIVSSLTKQKSPKPLQIFLPDVYAHEFEYLFTDPSHKWLTFWDLVKSRSGNVADEDHECKFVGK